MLLEFSNDDDDDDDGTGGLIFSHCTPFSILSPIVHAIVQPDGSAFPGFPSNVFPAFMCIDRYRSTRLAVG